MARTKLPEHEKRVRFARARVTVQESDDIALKAAQAGLTTAEFIRRRLLDYQVPVRADIGPIDPALITELNRLGLQLSAIGNNANQLALSAHTGRRSRAAWTEVVERINELLDLVKTTLEQRVLANDP